MKPDRIPVAVSTQYAINKPANHTGKRMRHPALVRDAVEDREERDASELTLDFLAALDVVLRVGRKTIQRVVVALRVVLVLDARRNHARVGHLRVGGPFSDDEVLQLASVAAVEGLLEALFRVYISPSCDFVKREREKNRTLAQFQNTIMISLESGQLCLL